MNRNCSTCTHWSGQDRTCRRYPPTTWATSDNVGKCGFPSALPDWYCSEYTEQAPGLRMVRGEDGVGAVIDVTAEKPPQEES